MVLKPLETISSVPLFAELGENILEALAGAARLKRFQVGETVFIQGDPCVGLYIVQGGWLKEIIASPAGREQIINLLRPGDVFNESSILLQETNLVTVRALESSALWIIERGTMLRLLEKYPTLNHVLAKNMAVHILHLTKLIEDLSLRTVKSRMARTLLDNAVEGVVNRRRWATQTEMAARLGTVLDVANRALNSLESDGMIAVRRHEIKILDLKRLEELAAWEE